MIHSHILRFHLYYCLVALIFLRFIFFATYSIPFWNVNDDYPVMSLAHAIYLDQKFSTNFSSVDGYAQTAHPGIVFQFVSYISYLVANLSISEGFHARLAHTFSDVSSYWLVIQLLPLIIFSLVFGILKKIVYLSTYSTLILMAIYFSFQPVWIYGFMHLGNETFALPIGLILFGSFYKMLFKNTFKFNKWIIIVGLIGSLAFLNKFNYAAWPLGILIALFLSLLFSEGQKKKNLANELTLLAFSLFLFTFLIVFMYLGFEGCRQILVNVWALLSHSGMYGSGPQNFVQPSIFYKNLLTSLGSYPYFWLLFVVTLFQAYLILNSIKSDNKLKNITFLNGLLFAIIIGVVLAFKQYNPHYLVPIVVCMVCIQAWSIKEAASKKHKYFILPFIFIALVNSFSSHLEFVKQSKINYVEENKELTIIKQLPLKQGQRFWSYGISSKEYNQYFLKSLVISPALDNILDANNPQDKHYDIFNLKLSDQFISRSDWRYVVFAKKYFSEINKTSDYFINAGKVCYQSDKYLVVENAKTK